MSPEKGKGKGWRQTSCSPFCMSQEKKKKKKPRVCLQQEDLNNSLLLPNSCGSCWIFRHSAAAPNLWAHPDGCHQYLRHLPKEGHKQPARAYLGDSQPKIRVKPQIGLQCLPGVGGPSVLLSLGCWVLQGENLFILKKKILRIWVWP